MIKDRDGNIIAEYEPSKEEERKRFAIELKQLTDENRHRAKLIVERAEWKEKTEPTEKEIDFFVRTPMCRIITEVAKRGINAIEFNIVDYFGNEDIGNELYETVKIIHILEAYGLKIEDNPYLESPFDLKEHPEKMWLFPHLKDSKAEKFITW